MYVSNRLPNCKQCDGKAVNPYGLCPTCTPQNLKDEIYEKAIRPEGKNLTGMEIECLVSRSDYQKLDAVGFRDYDSSIRNEGAFSKCGMGWESVELKFSDTHLKAIKRGIDAVNYISSLDSQVNYSCGLHVHTCLGLEKEPVPYSRTRTRPIYLHSTKQSSLLTTLKPLYPTIKSLFSYRTTKASHVSRDFVGLHKGSWIAYRENYGTMEVRVHEATLNPYIIHDWLSVCHSLRKLCQDVISNKKTSRVEASRSGDLMGVMRKNSPGERYLAKRMESLRNVDDYSKWEEFERSYR